MDLSQLNDIPRPWLTAEEVAPFFDANPQTIRAQAQHDPTKLGFPVVVAGSRVKIPKDAFIYFCRFGRPVVAPSISLEAIKYFIDQAIKESL